MHILQNFYSPSNQSPTCKPLVKTPFLITSAQVSSPWPLEKASKKIQGFLSGTAGSQYCWEWKWQYGRHLETQASFAHHHKFKHYHFPSRCHPLPHCKSCQSLLIALYESKGQEFAGEAIWQRSTREKSESCWFRTGHEQKRWLAGCPQFPACFVLLKQQ